MLLKEITASAPLSAFVRLYRIIDFNFPDNKPVPAKAYTPRPEQCLQFFLNPTHIAYPNGPVITPKNALLIGQHTQVNNRTVYQKFLSLQVVFQPGALYRLLGMPQNMLFDQAIEAEDILGKDIALVTEQLYHAPDHQQMIMVVEQFLTKLVSGIKKDSHPIDHIIRQMLFKQTEHPLDWYIGHSFLCNRQFNRKFIERAGISAKAYLRIIRFNQAYLLKNQFPQSNWFNIAIQAGYYDYQHLAKDYKDFTGNTPARFFAMDSPERVLGFEEVY